MKRFKAKIKYKGKTNTMLVSGKDEKSVIKNITDFYMNLFEDKETIVEVKLEEIK